jgi:hypothetical protein
VENEIHAGIDLEGECYVLPPEFEVRVSAEVSDISFGPGEQVVERENIHAFGQKTVAHMRSDESGSPRDNSAAHRDFPFDSAVIGTIRM